MGLRIKQNPYGYILKYKAMLVENMSHQQLGFDFQETFSLVLKLVTVRIILTLAIYSQWHITQLDMNNDFLNGLLEKEYKCNNHLDFSMQTLYCKQNKVVYCL